MKCEFCGQSAPEDFIACPNCNSWNSKIDRTGSRIYYLLGIGLALVLFALSPAVSSFIGKVLLFLLLVAVIIPVIITGLKLRRLKSGKTH